MSKKYKIIVPDFWKLEFSDKPWFVYLFEEPDSNLTLERSLSAGEQITVLDTCKHSIKIQTEDGIIGWIKPHVLKECAEII